VNTVELELNLSFVIFFGEFKIELIFFEEGWFFDFLISCIFGEFPIYDADFVLISQN
jgi:hypothetical protein